MAQKTIHVVDRGLHTCSASLFGSISPGSLIVLCASTFWALGVAASQKAPWNLQCTHLVLKFEPLLMGMKKYKLAILQLFTCMYILQNMTYFFAMLWVAWRCMLRFQVPGVEIKVAKNCCLEWKGKHGPLRWHTEAAIVLLSF